MSNNFWGAAIIVALVLAAFGVKLVALVIMVAAFAVLVDRGICVIRADIARMEAERRRGPRP